MWQPSDHELIVDSWLPHNTCYVWSTSYPKIDDMCAAVLYPFVGCLSCSTCSLLHRSHHELEVTDFSAKIMWNINYTLMKSFHQ